MLDEPKKVKHMFPWPREKELLERLALRKKIISICQRYDVINVMNMVTLKGIVPNSRRTTRRKRT